MLTGEEKAGILDYYAEVRYYVLETRREAQRVPVDRWVINAAKRFEGRLIAIDRIVHLLGLPADFLPNRDDIVV